MKRVLFFAEAVTLAHVARPIALADSLDDTRYEAIVACSPTHRHFFKGARWRTEPLESIDSARFLSALAQGRPVYDASTLERYVRQDLDLIAATAPDLVVGDFRLSLSVSCRLAGVPYGAVTNAYWSPYRIGPPPLPVLPLTRRLPLAVARVLFRLGHPIAFALHCRPLNQIRRAHGLPSLGTDLRRLYTDGDHTLYADPPGFFDLAPLPRNHRHLGAVLWSPPTPPPLWWGALPADKPIVYTTLGSSGQTSVLEQVDEVLATLPVVSMVSTAGQPPSRPLGTPYVAPYLPGLEAAARADLVICNGGSPTSQQALSAGVPVLGIASNMDQFLNMEGIVRAGAGLLLRADRLDRGAIRHAVESLLRGPEFTARARAVSERFDSSSAGRNFQHWVDEVTAR